MWNSARIFFTDKRANCAAEIFSHLTLTLTLHIDSVTVYVALMCLGCAEPTYILGKCVTLVRRGCVYFMCRLRSQRRRRSTVLSLPSPTTCSFTTIPSTVDVHAGWTRPTTVRMRPVSGENRCRSPADRLRLVVVRRRN